MRMLDVELTNLVKHTDTQTEKGSIMYRVHIRSYKNQNLYRKQKITYPSWAAFGPPTFFNIGHVKIKLNLLPNDVPLQINRFLAVWNFFC